MSANYPPICDYEGSDYRTRFWAGQGRTYEDQVERIALRRLMPPTGETLIEIGAGFGRLADEYQGYQTVVLFDYSRSLLREAQSHLADLDPTGTRFKYVAGNWYTLPFVSGLFDTMVQVRTLHHAADVPTLFDQLARIARPGGRFVLEFANKQNLKAIARHTLGQQSWSPYTLEPVEFVRLNFDFHPRWIRANLLAAGFHPGRMLTVSHFRLQPLKRLLPTGLLVNIDKYIQSTGRWWQLTPSVFTASDHPIGGAVAPENAFFACPQCQTPLNDVPPGIAAVLLICSGCARQWSYEQGLYDFKSPA
jgi:SAM-dependent methyltransferase